MSDLASLKDSIDKLTDDVNRKLSGLTDRIDALEHHSPGIGYSAPYRGSEANDSSHAFSGSTPNNPVVETTPAPSPTHAQASSSAAEDFEAVFTHIKTQVSHVSIQKDLDISNSKKNIRRPDHGTIDILSKSGTYSATALKVLASYRDGDSVESLINYLYYIHMAHIRYLQEKRNGIAVRGGFNNDLAANIFDMVQNNTLHLDARGMQNLQIAAQLAAPFQRAQPASNKQNNSFKQNFFNKSRDQRDKFDKFGSRQFPSRNNSRQAGQTNNGTDSSERQSDNS